MPSYKLTRRAQSDLQEVYFYSFQNFGKIQADSYAIELRTCLRLLAEQPRIGQVRPEKAEQNRLFFHRHHVIAYRIIDADILIQRVLDMRRNWHRILRTL